MLERGPVMSEDRYRREPEAVERLDGLQRHVTQ